MIFVERTIVICIMFTTMGFLLRYFSGFQAGVPGVRWYSPFVPTGAIFFFFFNLSHVLKIFFFDSVAMLYFIPLWFFIFLCCFFLYPCLVLVFCGGACGRKEIQKNSSVFGIRSLVMAQIRFKLNCRDTRVLHCIKFVCIIKNFCMF